MIYFAIYLAMQIAPQKNNLKRYDMNWYKINIEEVLKTLNSFREGLILWGQVLLAPLTIILAVEIDKWLRKPGKI